MQLYFGSAPIVVGSSIEMAKQFLKTHDLNFASRPEFAAGKYTCYDHTNVTWAPYGPYWRQARKIYLHEIFSAKRLNSYKYIRTEELKTFLADIYASCGQAITLRDHFTNYTLNNICRMILGKKYLSNSHSNSSSSIATTKEFKEMLDEWFLLNGALNIGDFIPWINFLDLQGYLKRMKTFGKKLDYFLEHVIDEHNFRRQDSKDSSPVDVVDVLLKLADDPNLEVKLSRTQIKGLIQDLLAGGTETSTVTVEWAMSELMKQPEVVERATEELDTVIGRNRWVEEEDIQHLPYLEAITKEIMRLHPVGPILAPHFSRADCKIAGYDIVAGTRIFINVWSIGRDPTLWDAPNEFHPGRFKGSNIDVTGHHFELLPFGSGRRMCPGYGLGLKLIQSGLANLLHGFNWKLADDMKPENLNMEETCGLTVPKKFPLVVVPQPRLPVDLYSQ